MVWKSIPSQKKLGQQLKYAAAQGFRVAVIAGEQEFLARTCQVKDLQARHSQEISLDGEDDLRRALAAILIGDNSSAG